jgi:Zn-dependent protease
MSFDLWEWILRIPVLLFAITAHEYAHGKAAFSLGDPTAKAMGRLTHNPFKHIDPLGAICLFLFNFGWARPVPVNPRYFKNPRSDIVLMSISGPLANFAAAFLAGLFIRYLFLPWEVYQKLLIYMLLMNLGLGIFNLFPIPPLDGAHVLETLLPSRAAEQFRKAARYGPMLLLMIVILDNFTQTGVLSFLITGPLLHLARWFSGLPF